MDKNADPVDWKLDALAAKMVQYCPLLEGLTGETMRAEAKVCVVSYYAACGRGSVCM